MFVKLDSLTLLLLQTFPLISIKLITQSKITECNVRPEIDFRKYATKASPCNKKAN